MLGPVTQNFQNCQAAVFSHLECEAQADVGEGKDEIDIYREK